MRTEPSPPRCAPAAGLSADGLLLQPDGVIRFDHLDRRVRGVGQMHPGCRHAGPIMARAFAATMNLVKHLPRSVRSRFGKEQHTRSGRPAGRQAFGDGVLHGAKDRIDDAHGRLMVAGGDGRRPTRLQDRARARDDGQWPERAGVLLHVAPAHDARGIGDGRARHEWCRVAEVRDAVAAAGKVERRLVAANGDLHMDACRRVVVAAVVEVILALIDAVRKIAQSRAHLDLGKIVQARLRRHEDGLAVLAAKLDDAPLAGLGRGDLGEEVAFAGFRSRTLALSSCTIGALTPAAVAISTGGIRIASWKVSIALAK